MDTAALRQRMLKHFAAGAAAARERIDGQTGRYLSENGGFAIAAQGVLFPLTLLYLHEGTKGPGGERLRADALRVGDALREFQNPDGAWEFVKDDGSSWGPTHMPWPFLPWLETWRLLREELGSARLERWKEGLTLWCDAVLRQFEGGERIHNIPAYQAAILVRAAELLGAPHYKKAGAAYLARVAEDQHPDGFWAEGGVPTTAYNGVYLHALGLYHAFTKDPAVLPCLRRALEFHLHFTYPDGSAVETMDGRVRYGGAPSSMGLLGFLPFAEGRRLAQFVLEKILDRQGAGGLDTGLAYMCQHLAEGETAEIPQTKASYALSLNGHASVSRAGPWFVCLNAYTVPVERLPQRSHIRWHMDMQNLLSVWHEKTGLLVGGGNSKHQPKFCTFEVFVGGAHYLQPEKAQILDTDTGRDVLELTYGPVRCTLAAGVESGQGRVRLQFSAKSTDARACVRGGLTLWGLAGQELQFPAGAAPRKLDPKASLDLKLPAGAQVPPLRIGQVEWQLPAESKFEYPVYPFNPYAIDGLASPQSAVAALGFDLPATGEIREVSLRVLG